MCRMLSLVGLCLLSLSVGCGDSPSTGPVATTSGNSASQSPQEMAIKTVAAQFLEAIKQGNQSQALALLTPKAQSVINQKGFEFVPSEPNPTMSFQFGETGTHETNEAFIDVMVLDVDEAGKTSRDMMTLAMRNENGRWGVFGIVGSDESNQTNIAMNLESANPDVFYGMQPSASPAGAPSVAQQPGTATPRQAQQPTQGTFRQ